MSIIIVKNDYGYTATIRFGEHPHKDRMLSSNSHIGIYKAIERVMNETGDNSI